MKSEKEICDKIAELEKIEKDAVIDMTMAIEHNSTNLIDIYMGKANAYRSMKEILQWVLDNNEENVIVITDT